MNTNLPSSTPRMPTPPGVNPPSNGPIEPAQGGNEQYDDLGYLIQPEDREPSTPPAPPVAPAAVVPPVTPPTPPAQAPSEKSVTGYGEDPSAVAPPVTPPPVVPVVPPKTIEQMNDEEKAKHLVTETIKDLSDVYDKDKITAYALKHKMSPEALADYVQMAKNDEAEHKQQVEKTQREQRANWYKELKSDPEFGGTNFDTNIHKVDTMMAMYMSDTKKVLTERGSMLPPYIMKDYLRVANLLNPTTKFEGGEPPAPPVVEVDFIDEMYQGQNG